MDLQGKFFVRIKDFYEQRKPCDSPLPLAQQFGGVIFHQPAQIAARQRAVGNHAGVARPVGNFPRFADRRARRQWLVVKALQIAPAPDAFLENRRERKGIKRHGRGGFREPDDELAIGTLIGSEAKCEVWSRAQAGDGLFFKNLPMHPEAIVE